MSRSHGNGLVPRNSRLSVFFLLVKLFFRFMQINRKYFFSLGIMCKPKLFARITLLKRRRETHGHLLNFQKFNWILQTDWRIFFFQSPFVNHIWLKKHNFFFFFSELLLKNCWKNPKHNFQIINVEKTAHYLEKKKKRKKLCDKYCKCRENIVYNFVYVIRSSNSRICSDHEFSFFSSTE